MALFPMNIGSSGGSFSLDEVGNIKGNTSGSSSYPSSITISGLEVGKKYLALVLSAYNNGSYSYSFTNATENWSTWFWSSSGGGVYTRAKMVCITANNTSVTCNIATNYCNFVIIASEDGLIP